MNMNRKQNTSQTTEPAIAVDTVLCPVIFEGRKFFGIREFDCISVGLFTEETLQGTFFTCIPISGAKYRKKHPTKARVDIKTKKGWTVFDIYSDWGGLSEMKIHNSLKKEIEYAKMKAAEHGLL